MAKNILYTLALACTVFLMYSPSALALNDTLARTPPMGWNSWNLFGSNPSEAKVKAVADAFVSSGLKDAGYKYIVVDDCWSNATRDASGTLVAQSAKFPNGMKTIADYVHGKGLKFGMYACPTTCTCCGEAGTYQHETKDAQTFAAWGVDYLKYDWCGVQSGEDKLSLTPQDIITRYVTMREALKATQRPVLFALCEKGQKSKVVPGTWSDTVGHIWRIGGDINASWSSITSHIDACASLGKYSGPTKGWNDPDMLEVGNGSLTDDENRTHFSMWCMMAAPLILGNDPSKMSAAIKTIITNKEIIAIDQDSLGAQATRIKQTGTQEVWVKPLKNGYKAVALCNRGTASASVSVNWIDSLIKWPASAKVIVRDLWKGKDSLAIVNGYSAQVPSHGVVILRLDTGMVGTAIAVERTENNVGIIIIRKTTQGLVINVPEKIKMKKIEIATMLGRTIYVKKTSDNHFLVPGATLTTGMNIIRIFTPGSQYNTLFFNGQ